MKHIALRGDVLQVGMASDSVLQEDLFEVVSEWCTCDALMFLYLVDEVSDKAFDTIGPIIITLAPLDGTKV